MIPFPSSSGYFDFELPSHERCLPHTFNLIATTDLEKVVGKADQLFIVYTSALSKCRSLWNKLTSSKSNEIFVNHTKKGINNPCPTRWNSAYDSTKEILALENSLKDAMNDLGIGRFTPRDFEFLKEYVQMLAPIAKAILELQGETEVFYRHIIPNLNKTVTVVANQTRNHTT